MRTDPAMGYCAHCAPSGTGLGHAIAAALLLGACSKPAPPPTPTLKPIVAWTSGKRLRARLLDGGDGAVRFQGWFDSKLGESCEFVVASDGSTRCLPNVDATAFYADSACSKRVIASPGASCEPAASSHVSIAAASQGACAGTAFSTYELGPPSPVTALYESNHGNCLAANLSPGMTAQALMTVVPPGTFVRATSKIVDTGDGLLGARVLTADDGASRVVALADEKGSFECDDCLVRGCTPGLGNYAHRCAPRGFSNASIGQYLDATCMSPQSVVEVSATLAADCVPPNGFALVEKTTTMSGCDAGTAIDVEEIGAPADQSNIYGPDSAGGCSVVHLSHPPSAFHALGAIVPPSQFVPITVDSIGKGRLRAPSLVDARGEALVDIDGSFVDTTTAEPCNPMSIQGASYCVPANATGSERVFTDAMCTAPASAVVTPPCGQMPVALVFTTSTAACSTDATAYAIGAAVPANTPTYALGEGVGCVAGVPAGANLHVLTPVDPRTVFPPITARTE